MATLRWLVGPLLIGFWAYVCVCNVALVYKSFFHHQRNSLVLLVGGLVGMAGFLILPMEGLRQWFWTPLVGDVAIPYLVGFGFSIVKKLPRH